MELNLSALFAADGVLPFEFTLDFSDLDYFGVYPIGKIAVCGKITSHSGIVEMTGKADFTYNKACDRCTEFISRPMSVAFEHTLVKSLADDENDELILVKDMMLDAEELVRCDVILALPTKFLCREGCKGICQKCGQNLNAGDCSCNKREIDPRLEALKGFLK